VKWPPHAPCTDCGTYHEGDSLDVMQSACSGIWTEVGDWCCLCGKWAGDCNAHGRADEEGAGIVFAAIADGVEKVA
jgi:hypothetical protein